MVDKMIWKMIPANLVWKWIEFYYMQISIPRRPEKPRERQRQMEIFGDSANVTEPDSIAEWYTSQKGHCHSAHMCYREANRFPLYTWYGNHTQSLEREASLEDASQYQLGEWPSDHWRDLKSWGPEPGVWNHSCNIARSGLKWTNDKMIRNEEMNMIWYDDMIEKQDVLGWPSSPGVV